MKLLLYVALITSAIVLSVWLLPWWVTVGVLLLIIGVAAFFVWKIISTVKKEVVPALKKVAEGFPRAQERLCMQPAGERFRGNGFSFSLPVECEVSQMVIDDLEALMLKPALEKVGSGTSGIMIVSTIPRDELKTRIGDQLDGIFEQVKKRISEGRVEDKEVGLDVQSFVPTQVGPFHGEARQMRIKNTERTVLGETVFLGEPKFSVGWALMAPEETFEAAAARYREFASCIERVVEQPPIEVPTVGR